MGKRRLGLGLHALLGGSYDSETDDVVAVAPGDGQPAGSDPGLSRLPIHDITPNPYQPRRAFDPLELAGLVESIQQHGVLQPLVVRRVADKYQLVAGERRLRAAQEAGLDRVPARIIEADDRQVFELAIVENLQRTDLNAMEKARAFHDYIARFGATQDELAARLGLDRSTVSNFVRLLELPEAIQQAVESGKVSQGHARALLAVSDAARQHELCRRIIAESLSVRQVETLVAGERLPKPRPAARTSPHKTSHVVEMESLLRERLGTQVEIRVTGKDRGQIVIEFASNEDFERVMQVIQGVALQSAAAA
jgi:ParB family chromosome partitioning protein